MKEEMARTKGEIYASVLHDINSPLTVISGFLQGFTLFLALPVDLGRPFGGLVEVGVTSALLLWLWVLHVVVCIGYTFTWAVDEVFSKAGSSA